MLRGIDSKLSQVLRSQSSMEEVFRNSVFRSEQAPKSDAGVHVVNFFEDISLVDASEERSSEPISPSLAPRSAEAAALFSISEAHVGEAAEANDLLSTNIDRAKRKSMLELQPRTFVERQLSENIGGKMKMMDIAVATGGVMVRRPQGWRNFFPLRQDSMPRMTMDSIGMVMLLLDTILVPYTVAYEKGLEGSLMAMAWITAVFWTLDVVSNFVTSFTQHDLHVMSFVRIAKRYLKTWFIVDVIVVGVDWFAIVLQLRSDAEGTSDQQDNTRQYVKVVRLLKGFRLVRVLAVLRSGRFAQVQDLMYRRATLWGINLQLKFAMGITKLIFLIAWMNHMGSCVWWIFIRSSSSDTGTSWYDLLASEIDADELVSGTENEQYLYLSGLYWSATAMFSGASFRPPNNSAEALFALCFIVLGMLFGSTLISSVAAMLVDFQMVTHDQTEKLSTLRKYLRQNGVPSSLSVSIQAQVVDRITAEKRLSTADVPVLSLLSSGLRSALLYEINSPRLASNPVLKLCDGLDDLLTSDICSSHALKAQAVGPGFVVFHPKEKLDSAFFVISGCVQYTFMKQDFHDVTDTLKVSYARDSTADKDTSDNMVGAKDWLADWALWVFWTSLGLAECIQHGELLVVIAEELGAVLRRHPAVGQIIEDYARTLANAVVEEGDEVNDISSKSISIDHIICALPLESRLKLSLPALHAVQAQATNNSTRTKALIELEKEVREGKCYLTSNDVGAVLRVVNLVALRIYCGDRFLAEVAKWKVDQGLVEQSKAKVPGTKTRAGELPAQALQRLITRELCLFNTDVEGCGGVVETSEAPSDSYGVTTRYIKTVFETSLSDEDLEDSKRHQMGLHRMLHQGYLRVAPQDGGSEDGGTPTLTRDAQDVRVIVKSERSEISRPKLIRRLGSQHEEPARQANFSLLELLVGSADSMSSNKVPLYAWVTEEEFESFSVCEPVVYEVMSEV